MMLLVVACAGLGGCATITNAGHLQTTAPDGSAPQPGGPTVRAAQLELKHMPIGLQVFEAGREVPIREADGAFAARLVANCYETERIIARAGGVLPSDPVARRAIEAHRIVWPDGCEHQRVFFYPVVLLDRAVPHTLRLVGDGREATVTVHTSLHPKWLYWNFWLLAAYPVGLAVDGLSHNWSYFWPLDVGQALGSRSVAVGK
jgi:hypothetical protein